MAKSKSRDEVEELRGKVRELQKENKELKKIVGRLQKNAHRVEDLETLFREAGENDVRERDETPNKSLCSCGGKLEKVDLGVRTLVKCVECGKRETKKK